MPKPNQAIGQTAAKPETLQYQTTRIDGITLKFTTNAAVAIGSAGVSNNRIVSLREDVSGKMFAFIGTDAMAGYTIIGWGVLESSLQSGGLASIAPTPNNYVDGDTVAVLRAMNDVYAIDYDTDNAPTEGIGLAYLDVQGRLSSVSTGGNIALKGAVFNSVPGIQMAGQLKDGCKFYQLGSPTIP